jgi:hypothetical protein
MILKHSQTGPAVCVALILLLSLGQPSTAQNSATQQELSEHLAALVRTQVVFVTNGNNDDEPQLRRGWRFSSRVPKGRENYMP